MPPERSRDKIIIQRFLSEYEDGSWADAEIDFPDKEDRTKKAVDALATRKIDGMTIAIEHTIIEPFVGDKEDFALFEEAFLKIEEDKSLIVPGRWIQVFVPVGTLRGQQVNLQYAIVNTVHHWIETNRLGLSEGFSEHCCQITGISGQPVFEMRLTVRVEQLSGEGTVHIRRQQLDNNLGDIVERALKFKLPKLVKTNAEKRILMLERQHMNLFPKSIIDEIEKRRAQFPELAYIDEIWIVETMFYGTQFGGTHLYFERYERGNLAGHVSCPGV